MYLLQVLIAIAPILLYSLAVGVPLDAFYSYPFDATPLTFNGHGLDTNQRQTAEFMLCGKPVNGFLVSFIIYNLKLKLY